MGGLVQLDDIDSFIRVRDVQPDQVQEAHLDAIRSLDERDELEPMLRQILFDVNETPHGPAELVDIFTHKLTIRGQGGLAAFILKGKSYATVRPKNVAHQIYRLEKIDGLRFAVLGCSGNVLDAVREQFTSTCERLDLRYTFFDAHDLARIFLGYGLMCPRDAKWLQGETCDCGYSPERNRKNLYQSETLRAFRESLALHQTRGLIVLPPGSGKTRTAAMAAKQGGFGRVWYVAPSQEILDVAEAEFSSAYGREAVCRHESGDSLEHPGRVNLSTIQLLNQSPDHVATLKPDLLIIDEVHHAAAPSYRHLIERAKPTYLLGLTATPFRGDRQDIRELCGNNILVYFEMRHGIETGLLTPYHYYGCFDNIDYASLSHRGKALGIRDLERLLAIPERDEAIVRKWRQLADRKATLAFCVSKRHARRTADAFNAAGISAAVYLTETPRAERVQRIQQLHDGDLRVLTTVDVLSEGADLPFVECLLFLRPTESPRLFYQQLGRGLRRFPGKFHCTVIDFIGNFKNAYKVIDYQSLFTDDEERESIPPADSIRSVLQLPVGCRVEFDERVIDIFVEQTLAASLPTRHTIASLLTYQYRRLVKRLGRAPTQRDVRRHCLLDDRYYKMVFGSWDGFLSTVGNDLIVESGVSSSPQSTE